MKCRKSPKFQFLQKCVLFRHLAIKEFWLQWENSNDMKLNHMTDASDVQAHRLYIDIFISFLIRSTFCYLQYNPSESDGGKKNARFSRGRAVGSRRSSRRRKSSESDEEETAPSSEDDFSDEPKRKASAKPTRAQRTFFFVTFSVTASHYFHSNYSWPRSSSTRMETSGNRI